MVILEAILYIDYSNSDSVQNTPEQNQDRDGKKKIIPQQIPASAGTLRYLLSIKIHTAQYTPCRSKTKSGTARGENYGIS